MWEFDALNAKKKKNDRKTFEDMMLYLLNEIADADWSYKPW